MGRNVDTFQYLTITGRPTTKKGRLGCSRLAELAAADLGSANRTVLLGGSGRGRCTANSDQRWVVTQPQADQYVGLSAVCPHQGCLVSQVTNQKIICPCHGSQFSITDGAVIQGPAQTGLPSVPVEHTGDQIVLA